MAWSAPRSWVVSEVVTASVMNTHIRDNLLYLKGQAGAVAIEDDLTIGATTAAAARLHVIRSGGGIQEALRLDNVTNTAGNGSSVIWRNAAQNFHAALIQAVRNGSGTDFLLQFGASANFATTDAVVGMTLTSGGLGIGTAAPQGALHAVGAGGGFMFVSVNAVAGTLLTPVVAGTVTQSAAFWGYDRNNTGGAFVQVSGNMLGLAQTFSFVNTDTVTVTLTAGGAITVQRTAGTNGTHQVNMLILYK